MDLPSICSISLHHSDLLRFHNFPSQLYVDLRQTVQLCWSHGIQAERDFHSSKELKLKGNPWRDSWRPVEATRLALRIMEFMVTRGWNLLTATSVGDESHTKDTWIFKRKGKNQPAVAGPVNLSALSFLKFDRIGVVDGSPLLANIVQATVERRWPKGLQDVRSKSGMPELKLRGNPWYSDGKENDETNGFLIALLSNLKARGFTFLTSVRLTHTITNNSGDGPKTEYLPLDTWVLISPS